MVDIATRVYNHKWKIDPIVRSLIDTDFYKLLMCQSVFRNSPDTTVTFSLINRSKDVRLLRQNDINIVLNAEPYSFGHNFFEAHGPSLCATALRVKDEHAALQRATDFRGQPVRGARCNRVAIRGGCKQVQRLQIGFAAALHGCTSFDSCSQSPSSASSPCSSASGGFSTCMPAASPSRPRRKK